MKTFARIHDGLVAELLHTDGDITSMFNPSLLWIDVSLQAGIAEGWAFDGSAFAPPPAPSPTPTAPAPTLAELQAKLMALSAQISALVAH